MDNEQLSIKQQCELLGLNRSSYYAKAKGLNAYDHQIMNRIDEIFTEHPYYGNRRMMEVLVSEGYSVGRKRVRRYYQMLGIEAIYPKMNLSKRNQAHKVYPYLLRGLKITRPNQVWSMDITYSAPRPSFDWGAYDWNAIRKEVNDRMPALCCERA